MFKRKESTWAQSAPNSAPAIRFGLTASSILKKLVIVPNDPASIEFFGKIEGLSQEVVALNLTPSQVNEISDELDATVSKFSRNQRRAVEDSIGVVYEGLHEILSSLESAIISSDSLRHAAEASTSHLVDLQYAKNYEEVISGLKKEIASLNTAVGQYREEAKLIRNVAAKHVEQLRTKLKVAEKAVSVDHLTKLGNRNAFDLQISFAISRLAQGDAYSLAILDVDKFKSINDSFGHLGGDAALIAISKRLTETFSQIGTTVVRIGGDEFAVLYKGPSLQLAAKVERVNSGLAKSSFEYNGSKIDLHASYGVIDLTTDHTPESAFADADYEMYQSKRGKKSAA